MRHPNTSMCLCHVPTSDRGVSICSRVNPCLVRYQCHRLVMSTTCSRINEPKIFSLWPIEASYGKHKFQFPVCVLVLPSPYFETLLGLCNKQVSAPNLSMHAFKHHAQISNCTNTCCISIIVMWSRTSIPSVFCSQLRPTLDH